MIPTQQGLNFQQDQLDNHSQTMQDDNNNDNQIQQPSQSTNNYITMLTNNNNNNNNNNNVYDYDYETDAQKIMIVEQSLKDWEEEMDMYSISQLERRQINLRSTHQNFRCAVQGMVCTTAAFQDKYLFLGTSSNQLFCYDMLTNQLIFEDYRHTDWVLSLLVLSIDNYNLLLSGGGLYDRTVCFYDLSLIKTENTIHFIDQKIIHKKSITKMLYLQPQNILITCGSDFQLKIWKLSIQKPLDSDDNAEQLKVNLSQQVQDNDGATDQDIFETNDQIKHNEQEDQQNEDNNGMEQMDDQMEEEQKMNSEDDFEDDEEYEVLSKLKVGLKLLHTIAETGQIYSLCESDDNFIVYGTGVGFIKIIKYNPYSNKIRQIRSLNLQKSIWCLQRFNNFKYIVGYSFQTQGRINIINIVTGQHIMSFFKHNECIHSFKIISKIEERNIIIKNKEDFIKQSRNSITLVGASKLGMVKVVNIGDKINTPVEYSYSFNQNIEWIPWNPISVINQNIDEENPSFKRYRIYCSTGNNQQNFLATSKLSPLIYFDWSV